MKRLFFFAIFLSNLAVAHAEMVMLRFEDLPQLVRTQNKNVLAGLSHVEGSRSRTGHLGRSFLPEIQAEGGGEVFQTGNFDRMTQPVAGVGGRLNLFRSGKDQLEEKILDARVGLTQSNFQQTYLHELARARLLYADILYYRELQKSLQQAIVLTGEHLGLIQKQIKAGLTTATDQLEFEMFLNHLHQDQLLFQEDYEHALAEIKAVLELSPETSLELNNSINSMQENNFLTRSFNAEAHHEVLLLKKKMEIAVLQKKQAYRWWGPSLEAYGSYALQPFREREYPAIGDRDEAVGGLVLSINLFDGLHSKTQGKAFGYQAKGYALEMEQKSRELDVFLEKLEHELKNRKKLMYLINQHVVQGRQYLTISSEEYSRGVKNGSQLLEASERFLTEKRLLAATRREYLQLTAELLALLGQ